MRAAIAVKRIRNVTRRSDKTWMSLELMLVNSRRLDFAGDDLIRRLKVDNIQFGKRTKKILEIKWQIIRKDLAKVSSSKQKSPDQQ